MAGLRAAQLFEHDIVQLAANPQVEPRAYLLGENYRLSAFEATLYAAAARSPFECRDQHCLSGPEAATPTPGPRESERR